MSGAMPPRIEVLLPSVALDFDDEPPRFDIVQWADDDARCPPRQARSGRVRRKKRKLMNLGKKLLLHRAEPERPKVDRAALAFLKSEALHPADLTIGDGVVRLKPEIARHVLG